MKPRCDVLLVQADARALPLAACSVQCCVTSPPYYGLRDYGITGQIGLETTPEAYLAALVAVFREVRRVLRDDGTCWVVIGDSYAAGKTGRADHGSGDPTSRLGPRHDGIPGGRPPGPVAQRNSPAGMPGKNLCLIPARLAMALQADGWIVRSEIIWAKPNPMPESVQDRLTRSHETVWLLVKNTRYFYDAVAINEPASAQTHGGATPSQHKRWHLGLASQKTTLGVATPPTRNARDVWTIPTVPYPGAHFATFPPALVRRCLLAGSRPGDVILDIFAGSGTSGLVAHSSGGTPCVWT